MSITIVPAVAADPGAALRQQIAGLVQQFADLTLAPKPFVPGESVVPVSGKVIRIHVDNGDPVEYGAALVTIE